MSMLYANGCKDSRKTTERLGASLYQRCTLARKTHTSGLPLTTSSIMYRQWKTAHMARGTSTSTDLASARDRYQNQGLDTCTSEIYLEPLKGRLARKQRTSQEKKDKQRQETTIENRK
jgi:hypothetical protein